MDVLPALCITSGPVQRAVVCHPCAFFWAEVNNLQCARQGWSGSDLPGSCSAVTLPSVMSLLWCLSALLSGTHGREGKLLFFGRNQRAQLHPALARAILTGTIVTLWVFSRIKFDTEPEWTFLTFFPFCHPACFRKSPDVGVCILSLSSLTVFVFQAWQQWKET